MPLLNAGLVATMLVYMAVVAPILAAVSLALLLPAVYFVPRIQRHINALAERRTTELRALGDDLVNAGENGSDGATETRSNHRVDLIFRLRSRIYMLKFLAKGLTNLVGHLGPFAIVTVGGWLVIEGRTEIGTIVAFISANERLLGPTRDLLSFYRQWQVARVQYRLYREAVTDTA
jgi:ABC-type bacteriocin/lantibiotic exporter with double-glycine peptidase domain